MQTNELTPLQIRQKGLEALKDALGYVGMVRFLQQFDGGSGDYTRDRDQWLKDVTVADVMQQIRQQQENDS
ncbi:hypothetical protein [Leptolyngbya sp. NIES-2104]|uniref:hypothetical protein n=1 Tax=Leptolyngbya sp. NIES-2104 TaxID=1552121 RepID=UPI0006ECC546|nr:hypothetical protein [Leptolyngbya sp. NIES-2104]GAP99417.1 hypothetical protein NIES2104_59780 [Leptolyngbya sp. NIES-2104]